MKKSKKKLVIKNDPIKSHTVNDAASISMNNADCVSVKWTTATPPDNVLVKRLKTACPDCGHFTMHEVWYAAKKGKSFVGTELIGTRCMWCQYRRPANEPPTYSLAVGETQKPEKKTNDKK